MKKFFFLFMAVIAMAACSDDGGVDDGGVDDGGQSSQSSLRVSSTSANFTSSGGEESIVITSSVEWTASLVNNRADGWCSISPSSGVAGSTTLAVATTANSTTEDRYATIVVKAGGLEKTINVVQKQKNSLTLTTTRFELESTGGNIEIEVKSNVSFDYEIEGDANNWVSYKNTRAMSSSTLVFAVDANEGSQKREAKISFTSGDIKEVVTIYQQGDERELTLTKDEYDVAASGETIAVEVKSNVDVTVVIPEDVDWIKENIMRSLSTNTYYFDISDNDTYQRRTANIKFASDDDQLSEVVTVRQAAKTIPNNMIFYTSSDGEVVTPYNSDAFGATIVSNTYEEGVGGVILFDGDVTSIGYAAFGDCASLVSITIPNSVTSIGNEAFLRCASLESITIPNSVISIGEYAFQHCESLESIDLGEGVKTIEKYALSHCYSLKSVVIPDGVTTVGYALFWNSTSLESVTIPDSVTSIEKSAFLQCESLESIDFGAGIKVIGDYAFRNCYSLKSVVIPNGVITIGEFAFWNCTLLENMTIPDSVTKIGVGLICECYNMRAFYSKFASSDNRCLIMDGELKAFAPEGLTSYTIPNSVTSIGEYAFQDCESLESIDLGESVKIIEKCALNHCYSLKSVVIPNSVTSIGEYAFQHCESLESIDLGEGVKTIEKYALSHCYSLKSVVIPNSVTSIGEGALWNNTSLTTVYCKSSTPPVLGAWVLQDTPSLQAVYVPNGSVTAYQSAEGWSDYADKIVSDGQQASRVIYYTSSDGKVVTPYKIDVMNAKIVSNTYDATNGGVITFNDEITILGDSLFYASNTLVDVTIPQSVVSIKRAAFAQCKSLVELNIPNSVVDIGKYAFAGCSSLSSVTIPDSIEEINPGAFAVCTNLSAFYGKFASSDNRCLIVNGTLNSFASKGLTSYNIPEDVIAIGDSAFRESTLINITIPDNVTSIDLMSFAFSSYLKSVYIGSNVKTIGYAAFYLCENLEEVYIPNSLIEMGDYAFYECPSLSRINQLGQIKSIGYAAFGGCTSLASITIPDSVTSIGTYAFNKCVALKNIKLSDNLISIGKGAFFECISLSNISIPASVKSMGDHVFAYCKSLASVFFTATTPPTIGVDVFYENLSSLKIYVPTSSANTYKSANNWSNYASKITNYIN